MKKLSVFLAAFALLFGSFITTAANYVEKEKKPLSQSQEMASFLKNSKLDLEKDINAKVSFMINKEHEIVVLTVDTQDQVIEKFIKSRLNYQKLQNKLLPNKVYHVSVLVKADQ